MHTQHGRPRQQQQRSALLSEPTPCAPGSSFECPSRPPRRRHPRSRRRGRWAGTWAGLSGSPQLARLHGRRGALARAVCKGTSCRAGHALVWSYRSKTAPAWQRNVQRHPSRPRPTRSQRLVGKHQIGGAVVIWHGRVGRHCCQQALSCAPPPVGHAIQPPQLCWAVSTRDAEGPGRTGVGEQAEAAVDGWDRGRQGGSDGDVQEANVARQGLPARGPREACHGRLGQRRAAAGA